MDKVTGIGGIPPPENKIMVEKHLGLNSYQYGTVFVSKSIDTGRKQYLQ